MMSDPALVDSNVLVYATDLDNPHRGRALSVLEKANTGELDLCLSLQILAELYAVITNPRKVRQPLIPALAADTVHAYLDSGARLLATSEGALRRALELARGHGITGRDFFDAQIAATMLENGVTTIVTANEADFRGFEGIEVVNPFR